MDKEKIISKIENMIETTDYDIKKLKHDFLENNIDHGQVSLNNQWYRGQIYAFELMLNFIKGDE